MPFKALSIRQPWAWLIAKGLKDIENRSWESNYRGDFFIHASSTMTNRDYSECLSYVEMLNRDQTVALPNITLPDKDILTLGGIIGAAYLSACVTHSDSPWFTGEYGFVIKNPRFIDFKPCKGSLKFFYPNY